MNDQRPSRFLREIPTHLQYLQDASHWRADQMTTFFNEWLGNVRIQQATATPVYTAASFSPASTVGQKLWKTGTAENLEKTEHAANATTARRSSVSEDVVWKKNQPVKHATFGIGIIKDIEMKGADTIYLTISFKTGTKKISAAFVSTI